MKREPFENITDRRLGSVDELTLQQKMKIEHSRALEGIDRILVMFDGLAKGRSVSTSEVEKMRRDLVEYLRIAELTMKSFRGMLEIDKLTNIVNRDGLEVRIAEQISAVELKQNSAEYTRKDFYLCLAIDLDNFKPLNDALGHDGGDIALAEFAAILKGLVRESDIFLRTEMRSDGDDRESVGARTGGDEFVVVLPMDIANVAPQSEIETKVDMFMTRFKAKLLEKLRVRKFKKITVQESGNWVQKVICEEIKPGEKLADGEFIIGATVGSAYCDHEKDTDMKAKILETLNAADMNMLSQKGEKGQRGKTKEYSLFYLMIVIVIAIGALLYFK